MSVLYPLDLTIKQELTLVHSLFMATKGFLKITMVSDPGEQFQRNLKNTKFTILFSRFEIRQ